MQSLAFDEDKTAQIFMNGQKEAVGVEIVDYIDAFEEELQPEFIKKIMDFVGESVSWGLICEGLINSENLGEIQLITIYVLSEQEDDLVLGLLYRVCGDIEHGRGIKLKAKDHSVVEYGLGDVAFC